jgi:undecaprenyl pyrophosphate phosphatase UppP
LQQSILIRYLRTRSLMPFVVYRVVIGLATLGKVFWG